MSVRPTSGRTNAVVPTLAVNARLNAVLAAGLAHRGAAVDGKKAQRRDAAYLDAPRKAKAAKAVYESDSLYKSENWADTLLKDPNLYLAYKAETDFQKLPPYTQMLVYTHENVPWGTELTQLKFSKAVCGELVVALINRSDKADAEKALDLYTKTLRQTIEENREGDTKEEKEVTDEDVRKNMRILDVKHLLKFYRPDYTKFNLYVTVGHFLDQEHGLKRYQEAVSAMFDHFDENNDKKNVNTAPKNAIYGNQTDWRGHVDIASLMPEMRIFLKPTLAVLDYYVGKLMVSEM